MIRLTTIVLVVASFLCPAVHHAAARRPSIPIEVTGEIENFDAHTHRFRIRTEQPVKMLTITVGSDCKFKQNGAETGERILKRGARVRVNYFATVFTGNVAVEIESIDEHIIRHR